MGEFEGIIKNVTFSKLSVDLGGKQRDDVLEARSGALGNFCSNVGPQHWYKGKRTEFSDGFISLKRKQQQKWLKGNAIKVFELDFDSD